MDVVVVSQRATKKIPCFWWEMIHFIDYLTKKIKEL